MLVQSKDIFLTVWDNHIPGHSDHTHWNACATWRDVCCRQGRPPVKCKQSCGQTQENVCASGWSSHLEQRGLLTTQQEVLMPGQRMLGTGTASILEGTSILFPHNQGMLMPGNGMLVRGKGVLVITSKGTRDGECWCYMKECLLQSKVSSGGTRTIIMPCKRRMLVSCNGVLISNKEVFLQHKRDYLCKAKECFTHTKQPFLQTQASFCQAIRYACARLGHPLPTHSANAYARQWNAYPRQGGSC